MKIITLKQLSDDIGLAEDVLLNEVHDVMSRIIDGKHRFIIGEGTDAKIVIVDSSGLIFIKSNIDKGPLFLSNYFNVELNVFLEVVAKLRAKGLITELTFKRLVEAKHKPSVKLWFEPDTIVAGDTGWLFIEIASPIEVRNPKVSLSLPKYLELTYEPRLPSTFTQGKHVLKYAIKPERHGKYDVIATLEGVSSDGRIISVDADASPLKVRTRQPKVDIELRTPQISALFNQEFNVTFRIHNSGGDSTNMKIVGLEKHEGFRIVSGDYIGSLAPNGSLIHSLRLLPRKSGRYELDQLVLSFQDLEGNEMTKEIPPISVDVKVLEPRIKVELIPPRGRIRSKQEFTLHIRVLNVGEGKAKNISTKLPIPLSLYRAGPLEVHLPELGPGDEFESELTLEAPQEAELRIGGFRVNYQDEEGKELITECAGISIPVIVKEAVEMPWPFKPGAVIREKFRILQEVGEGGSAKVYLAEHLRLEGKKVALKALKPSLAKDPAMVERFMTEAKITLDQRLRDPNILHVYDVDVEEYEGIKYPFIVMEYRPSGTLKDKLTFGQPLPIEDVILVLIDVCRALETSHRNKIVHGDVKPSNIFYDEETRSWKLGDFGLSMLLRGREHASLGWTPFYMAPEVKKGKITTKSDVYSLGMLLREMLTGKVTGDLLKVKEYYKGVDESLLTKLVDLTIKMTAQNPDERPDISEVYLTARKLVSLTWTGLYK